MRRSAEVADLLGIHDKKTRGLFTASHIVTRHLAEIDKEQVSSWSDSRNMIRNQFSSPELCQLVVLRDPSPQVPYAYELVC